MSNYDKIKAMSKQELAKFFADMEDNDYNPWFEWVDRNYCNKCENDDCNFDCECNNMRLINIIIHWLEDEA